LYINHNQLTEIPSSIGKKLKQLHILNASSNSIHKLPVEIGQLSALESLMLDKNALTELPDEIGDLKISLFTVSSNTIRKLPKLLEHLTNLTELNLNYNELDNIVGVGQLSALQKLYLIGNNIKKNFPTDELLPLQNHLFELSLSENPITELPEQILQLVKLKDLDLSKLELVNIPFAEKLNTTLLELKSIHLRGNNFAPGMRKTLEAVFGKKAFLEDEKQPKLAITVNDKGKETILIDDDDEEDDGDEEDSDNGEGNEIANLYDFEGDSEDDEEYIENDDEDDDISDDDDGVFVSSDDETMGELKDPPKRSKEDEEDEGDITSAKKRKRKTDDEEKSPAKKKKKVTE